VKSRLYSGERKLSNQNQHLFEEGRVALGEEGDKQEVLVSILLLLLQNVASEGMVLSDQEQSRWANFTQLKRRVNKARNTAFFFFLFAGLLDFCISLYLWGCTVTVLVVL